MSRLLDMGRTPLDVAQVMKVDTSGWPRDLRPWDVVVGILETLTAMPRWEDGSDPTSTPPRPRGLGDGNITTRLPTKPVVRAEGGDFQISTSEAPERKKRRRGTTTTATTGQVAAKGFQFGDPKARANDVDVKLRVPVIDRRVTKVEDDISQLKQDMGEVRNAVSRIEDSGQRRYEDLLRVMMAAQGVAHVTCGMIRLRRRCSR